MSEESVVCPKCGETIALTRLLTARIEQRLRSDFESRAEAREQEHRRLLAERLAEEQEKARARVLEEVAAERRGLKTEIEDKSRLLEDSRGREVELMRKTRLLEEAQKTLDLEVERRVQSAGSEIEARAAARLAEEHRLRDAEKDKQLTDMRRQIEDLRRKAEQGSQQAQGECAELDLEEVLRRSFPHDMIRPVPKGVRGADVVHTICEPPGRPAGTIVWETKNTRAWSPAWLAKLRDDQRELKADAAVLASAALPAGMRNFGLIEGVWVCDFHTVPALASVLRIQLARIAEARAASEGRESKMESLYAYLTGSEFRHRIEAAVESFLALKDDLDRERRAMETTWARREKQIQRAMTGLAGMYGDMQGIVGTSLPPVAKLELPPAERALELDRASDDRG